MTGLLDIGPISKTVKIGGKDVDFFGLSAEDVFHLMSRFDEIKMMLQNRASEITPERLMQMGPEAIAAIIACSSDSRGNREAEGKAKRLSFPKQLEILKCVFDATFEDGIGPFVENMQAVVGSVTAATADLEKKVQSTTSGPATTSPARLSASPDVDLGGLKPSLGRRANSRQSSRSSTESAAVN